MTLLECLDSTNPDHGGTVESTRQRCLALQSMGHSVQLLTLDDKDTPWTKEWPIQVHTLGRGISRYGYNPLLERWINKSAAKFDAIVVNGVWRYLGAGIRKG